MAARAGPKARCEPQKGSGVKEGFYIFGVGGIDFYLTAIASINGEHLSLAGSPPTRPIRAKEALRLLISASQ